MQVSSPLAALALNTLPVTFPKTTGAAQPLKCVRIVRHDPQLPLEEGRAKTRVELPIVVGNFFALANGARRNDVTVAPTGVGIVGVVYVVVVIAGKQDLAIHAISVVPDVVARRLRQFGKLGGRIDPVESVDKSPDLRALANDFACKNTKAVNGAFIEVSFYKEHVYSADGCPRVADSPARHESSVATLRFAELLCSRLALRLQPLVEIGADRCKQRFDLAVKEMIGALHNLLLDHNALLGLQLVHQRCHVFVRDNGVLVPMNDETRRRAGSQEGEIIKVGRRADRDKAFDFRTAHQKLHSDPGAERKTRNPAALGFRIDGLCPVERGRGIRQFALSVIERPLAAADATKIEPERGEATMHKRVIELIDDRVIHRPAKLRVRMKDDCYRRVLLSRGVVTPLDASGGAGKNNLWHCS